MHPLHHCNKCRLAQSRTNIVVGSGAIHTNMVIVGEAPGQAEDKHGIPFIGRAGKELESALQSINIQRENIFITNIVKCRPPNNRDPKIDEINACIPYLWEQIQYIKPYLIVPLGSFATKYILNKHIPMHTAVEHLYQVVISNHSPFIQPIYHPAAILYNPQKRPVFYHKFQEIYSILYGKQIVSNTKKK